MYKHFSKTTTIHVLAPPRTYSPTTVCNRLFLALKKNYKNIVIKINF